MSQNIVISHGDDELVMSGDEEQAMDIQSVDGANLVVPSTATLDTVKLSVIEKNANETK